MNTPDETNEQLQDQKITRATKEYTKHEEKKRRGNVSIAEETQKNPKQGRKRKGGKTRKYNRSRRGYCVATTRTSPPDHARRLVGGRTILLKARLRKPTAVAKTTQRPRTATSKISAKQTDLLIQDDVDYADDAALLIEKDTRGQMCDRMGNYGLSAETRDLKIQWGNVLLLVHAGREPKEALPPPFDRIKFRTG